jgi:hypothetical protein
MKTLLLTCALSIFITESVVPERAATSDSPDGGKKKKKDGESGEETLTS